MPTPRRCLLVLLSLLTLHGYSLKATAKTPDVLKSLPTDADFLIHLDIKGMVKAYHGFMNMISGFVPDDARREVPSWDQITAQVEGPTGIDLNKVGTATMAFYFDAGSGKEPRAAVIISGLQAKGLKGRKVGEHRGVALHTFEVDPDAHYAQLDPSHLAVASTREKLQEVIDLKAGRGKPLAGSSAMLDKLLAEFPGQDLMRIYLLSSGIPGMGRLPGRAEGGGIFMGLKRGFSVVVLSDKQGATQLKMMAEAGLAQIRAMMAREAAMLQKGPEADAARQMMNQTMDFLNAVDVKRDGGKLTVYCKDDQEPMVTVGILAAIAIPAVIEYIRKSKASEVHEYLDRCYKGAVDYYDKPRARPDGTVVFDVLPPSMKEPVCPGGKTIETLNGESARFDPGAFGKGGKAEVLRTIGFGITEPSYGCYQYIADKDGKGFTCQAWTDIDDDGIPAHWMKKATLHEATGSFRAGAAVQDPSSDNY